tara:strand:- start:12 stop:926 length:915 start_codon:yes stop_codon:yes gene_type:complete
MKISILGLNSDSVFFLKRSSFMKKDHDLSFHAFDDRKIQNTFKKEFSNIQTPWNLSDVLKECDLLLNCSGLKNLPNSITILEDNKIDCPIIDFSTNKKYSIKLFNNSTLPQNNIIHAMSPGRVNIDLYKELINLPIILNNSVNSELDSVVNLFLKRLKISLKFMDEIEHDEVLRSNYYLPNLLLVSLSIMMEQKSKIISNNLNSELISNIRSLVNVNINNDLTNDHIDAELDESLNEFNKELKKFFVDHNKLDNSYFINSKQTAKILDPDSSIPKSKDTIMSLFFGTRFTKLLSGWSKIDKSND